MQFSQLKKVKKASGEIIGVNVVCIISMLLSLAAVQVAGGMGADIAVVSTCLFRFTRRSL